jgi:CRISPR system Cascade subunit CasA
MSETGSTLLPISFNLWHNPWIRVIQPDGQMRELSIGACLAEAHTLAALQDASPLVVAGTHRLLVAILQAIYAPESLDDIADVLRAGQFDQGKLDDFAALHAERFDLFHPTAPFLQTGDVPLDGWRKPEKAKKDEPKAAASWAEPKPIAPLFDEVPGTTYRALYHHITDDQHRVCPACCARGLLTLAAFASSGGAGIRPSINGVPPVYVLPAGTSLFETLALSLTTLDYQPESAQYPQTENAAWNRQPLITRDREQPTVSYLESLTFPARRVRLYPLAEHVACTQCGVETPIYVQQMLFEMGHRRSEGAPVWEDPFVAFRAPGGKRAGESGGVVPVRPQPGKALWREYTGLLLLDRETQLRPKIVRQLAALYDADILDDRHMARFRCIGIRSDGKAKIFEWLDEALEAPPDLLNDALGIELIDQALDQARQVEQTVRFTFDQHFRPLRAQGKKIDNKMVRFRTLRDRMLATFWQRLADDFRQFVRAAADPFARDNAIITWINRVIGVGERTFNQAAEQVGNRADALRARVLAQDACWERLRAKRKEWIGE